MPHALVYLGLPSERGGGGGGGGERRSLVLRLRRRLPRATESTAAGDVVLAFGKVESTHGLR